MPSLPPTIHHQAHLGTVQSFAARTGGQPPVGLPPRWRIPDRMIFHEAGSSPGVFWFAPVGGRRRVVFGHTLPGPAGIACGSDRDIADDNLTGHRLGISRRGRGQLYRRPCGVKKAGKARWIGRSRAQTFVAVDGRGIPWEASTAPANRNDSPLLSPHHQATRVSGGLPTGRVWTGCGSFVTRGTSKTRADSQIMKGQPAHSTSWPTTLDGPEGRIRGTTPTRSGMIVRSAKNYRFLGGDSQVVIVVGDRGRVDIRYRWEKPTSRRPAIRAASKHAALERVTSVRAAGFLWRSPRDILLLATRRRDTGNSYRSRRTQQSLLVPLVIQCGQHPPLLQF